MNEQRKHDGREQNRYDHQAENSVPSNVSRQTRRKERSEKNAAVSRRGNAHRQPLMLWWIGAARDGQRYGKTRARRPQQKPDPDHLGIVLPEQPAQNQCHHFDPENAEAHSFRTELIRERPDHDAQQGAAK